MPSGFLFSCGWDVSKEGVNARLLVDTRRGAVIVPAASIQRSPTATFVYVVKDDQTVEMRNVVPGPVEGEDASLDSGLKPGEMVVIDGVDKLQQGAKVEARVVGEPSKGRTGRSGDPGVRRAPGQRVQHLARLQSADVFESFYGA